MNVIRLILREPHFDAAPRTRTHVGSSVLEVSLDKNSDDPGLADRGDSPMSAARGQLVARLNREARAALRLGWTFKAERDRRIAHPDSKLVANSCKGIHDPLVPLGTVGVLDERQQIIRC